MRFFTPEIPLVQEKYTPQEMAIEPWAFHLYARTAELTG